MAFTPYDPSHPVDRHRLHLPHWRQDQRTYFVTSRQADSIPDTVREEWFSRRSAWLAQRGISPEHGPDQLPEDERNDYHRRFTARFHELLDAGYGECLLGRQEFARILIDLLIEGHDARYHLDAWVMMPNHFHVLVEPLEGQSLGGIVKGWKGASARFIHRSLGRSGSFWQAEAFDHIVRSEKQLLHFRRYIAENPMKAGLRDGFVLGLGNRMDLSPDEVLER